MKETNQDDKFGAASCPIPNSAAYGNDEDNKARAASGKQKPAATGRGLAEQYDGRPIVSRERVDHKNDMGEPTIKPSPTADR